VYGLFDPKAKKGEDLACPCGSHEPLDQINGHFCEVPPGEGIGGGARSYHYHASKTFPYINGGLRGKVELEATATESQVIPQPRATGVRPALPPLRGASITGFEQVGPKAWSLRYEVGGRASFVNYRVEDGGKVIFEFVGPDGGKRVEEHMPRARGGRAGGGRPPRDRPAGGAPSGLVLTSAGVGADGLLDPKHTCDGASVSPPFAWTGLPAGTKSIALTIHHLTTDNLERIYLVRYGIPADAASIAAGDATVGKFGLNNVGRRAEYAPPCSQGPGEKTYVATVFALSAEPKLATATPTREELLAAVKDITLATGTLELRYARTPGAGGAEAPRQEGGQRRGQGQGQERGQGQGRGQEQGGGDRGTLIARMTSFKTEVPAHDHDVVLVRPTRSSTSASIVASTPRIGFVEFRRDGEPARRTTPEQRMAPQAAATFVMDGLVPDATYRYRFGWRAEPGAAAQFGEEQSFDTVRSPGRPFMFAVQADSHLDQGVTPAAYERTLLNIREEGADFLVDLGDTFMTDKRGAEFRRTEAQYDAQRYWFGVACRSMPLFMVLGNHDGEKGGAGGRDGEMPGWSYAMRTARFPAPEVGDASGGMYSGRTGMADGRAANSYAFEWGDALCVVLDPFWSTTERIRGGAGGGGQRGGGEGGGGSGPREPLKPVDGSWTSTLGREQYDWLGRTLAGSKAAHKFVFIHHLVGGMGGAESRGGVESVPYFEWGGRNADGSDGFATRRPGWPMPVHDLLVKHGVSAVFHGHDHLYVHGERDGIHYQCVPQPGNLAGGTRSAADYGYASGKILGSPGHVRVRVAPDAATVEFVRTAIDAAAAQANGTVVDSYRIIPRRSVSPGAMQDRPGRRGPRKGPPQEGIVKPAMSDTMRGAMYADNWFAMWINGRLVAVDSIDFLPHNVVSVDLLPDYPMTIAVLAKDNADPVTGCEYGRQIGDGGFILKFADGTVTNASWKARCIMHGPIGGRTDDPKVRTEPAPEGWQLPGFDDSSWANASEYAQERIDPKQPFFEHDFSGAKWIWTSDLDLDNTVLLRTRVEKPGWKPRWTTKPDLDATVK
ncbi:MAG: metallophosphoesterase, partial [Phycisphaerales bacterium]